MLGQTTIKIELEFLVYSLARLCAYSTLQNSRCQILQLNLA